MYLLLISASEMTDDRLKRVKTDAYLPIYASFDTENIAIRIGEMAKKNRRQF